MTQSGKSGFLYRRIAGRELGTWFFVAVFPALFAAGGLFLFLSWYEEHVRAADAASWPVHQAVIEVSGIQDGNRLVRGARIVYAYAVGNREFRGSRVTYGATLPGEADELVHRYPAGSSVDLRVDPADPGNAVLEPRTGRATWVMPAFGSLLLVAGLLTARTLEKSTRPKTLRRRPKTSTP